METIRRFASALFVCLLIAAALAKAGALTPPGAPAPTMKALDVVEPRIPVGPLTTPGDLSAVHVITQPGSYYLTANVIGAAGRSGIRIHATNVTLDLTGFSLEGAPGTNSGIWVSSGRGVRIMNGAVRNWGGDGFDLTSSSGAVVMDCVATTNGGDGFDLGEDSMVLRSLALVNTLHGFNVGENSTVRSCTASDNGLSGVSLGIASAMYDSVSSHNGQSGVQAAYGSVIARCESFENVGDGVNIASGGLVTQCVVVGNGDDGIDATNGVTIRDNSVYVSTGDGIEVSFDCLVIGNKIDNAGNLGTGAGVHALGDDNHIEGNSVTDSDIGILVDSTGNLIIRNAASGNTTNYSIVANNKVGVIVAAPNSIAINGSSGGAGVGTTDPWANLSY